MKTGSTCSPRTAQGTHVFDIVGYSKHRGMGTGGDCFIRSRTFAVGGHDWAIRFYPDGFNKGESPLTDYISVYLEILSKFANVRASCDLRLVDRATGQSSSVHKTPARMFHDNDITRFAPQTNKFMERRKLERSVYLRDDRLTIECVITVMKEPMVSKTKHHPKIEAPPSDIGQHLRKLLEGKEGADVTFCVGEEIFMAHKIVLAARSPVLKAELYGPMKEATISCVTIQDMQPAVFRALLHFIYTDSLPDMDDLVEDDIAEMIRHLFVAADRYAVDRLKLICQRILCKNLNSRTVVTTLALADQHHCDDLKDSCIRFIIATSNSIHGLVATQEHRRYGNLSNLVDALWKRVVRFCKACMNS